MILIYKSIAKRVLKVAFIGRYPPFLYKITGNRNMGRSGNVDDAQLGIFRSVDGGNTFVAYRYNPVFVNDYSNPYENEHMGGNFELIHTDTADFIIYQAKTSFHGLKYSVLIREKPLQ